MLLNTTGGISSQIGPFRAISLDVEPGKVIPIPSKPAVRASRPANHDYKAELQVRLGQRPHLFHMESYGPQGQRRPYEFAEGVAVIDIHGYLCADAFWWDETSYSEIRDEVTFALNDPGVKGILLRVDSPGGETDGAFETAAFLAEAGKKKPMWAVADVSAYSGAYLLASQAKRIYAAPTSGGVGSIGVYMMHADMSGYLKQNGIAVTFLKAGDGKTAGNPYEPLSAEAKKAFQGEVDRLYSEFVGAVARGRRMKETDVIALGSWLYQGGEEAVAKGLADKAGTVEDAWLDLATKVQSSGTSLASFSAKAETTPDAAVEISVERTTMNEKPIPAAEPVTSPPAAKETAPVPTAAEIEQRVTEARNAGHTEAADIAAMCALSGKTERISGFLADNTPLAKVRETLLKEKADADAATQVSNRVDPPADKGEGKSLGSLIVAHCEKIGADMNAARKGA